ncbi:hypothetical protein DYB25_004048 [Aphanomyces astaci]|uniref:FYVE-type domain-containing protein n=1 Tax=Aphanomyces astaci TaxID=112090 RepID=A0A397FMX1_APHAT|nr:hypothetical protein DYB25_004048 [Aphanomyces astaci]RHY36300.1 hypothetical protein DYB34_000893 [Aphanomyces astaci]RHZ34561.1 hypothetical protein DYB31_000327 [Aphanomyces astaci]
MNKTPDTPFLRRCKRLSMEPLGRDEYLQHVKLTHAKAHALMYTPPTSRFRFLKHVDGIDVSDDPAAWTCRVKATMTLRRPASAVMASMAGMARSSHDFRLHFYRYFRQSFVDGMHLHCDSKSDHVSVNYLVLRREDNTTYDMTFAATTMTFGRLPGEEKEKKNRDQGLVVVPLQACQVGVQVWESVVVPGLDDDVSDKDETASHGSGGSGVSGGKSSSSHDSHRRVAMVTSGIVVEALDPTQCRVSVVLQFGQQQDESARSTTTNGMSIWQQRLAQSALASLRTELVVLVPQTLWMFNEYCYLCYKTFGTFTRRHHCRLCGHSICSKCTENVPTDAMGVLQSDEPTTKKTVATCRPCGRRVCGDADEGAAEYLPAAAASSVAGFDGALSAMHAKMAATSLSSSDEKPINLIMDPRHHLSMRSTCVSSEMLPHSDRSGGAVDDIVLFQHTAASTRHLQQTSSTSYDQAPLHGRRFSQHSSGERSSDKSSSDRSQSSWGS